jgi:HD-like signal output (HDOD) protein
MAAEQTEREIQQLIEGQISLPSPSGVALQILNLVRDPDSSFDDLEKIITADPALAGKILRIANSSFYSPNSSVNSMARALSLLGTNVIKNIALSFVLAEDLMGSDQSLFDFNLFWRRAITAAVAGELVMNELPGKNDSIFIMALLKDIGIMVLYQSMGEEYLRLTTKKSCFTQKRSSLTTHIRMWDFSSLKTGAYPQVSRFPFVFIINRTELDKSMVLLQRFSMSQASCRCYTILQDLPQKSETCKARWKTIFKFCLTRRGR